MNMDFSGPPPQAKTLQEAQTIIDALWLMLRDMQTKIKHLESQVASQALRIQELENRLTKDSHNSHKPPSSDGFNKPSPKSLRKSGERKSGGQKGHPGMGLELHPAPDEIINHEPLCCRGCGYFLAEQAVMGCKQRQVYEIPPLNIRVTEHRAHKKQCPNCQLVTRGHFPEAIKNRTQYGHGIKALIVYLSQYQLLPYERIQEFFTDLFCHAPSQGTLVKTVKNCFERLAFVDNQIKYALQGAPILHSDETGIRVKGKLHWCHVASTDKLTSYGIHPKRGTIAIETIGIISQYQGTLIHDHFKPYFRYDCHHALCNAHHLRELAYIKENQQQDWAQNMGDLLVAIKKQVAWHKVYGLKLLPSRIAAYERCYDEIIMQGLWHPDNICKPQRKKQGFSPQTKAKNLLDRLRYNKPLVLGFMYDFRIPFDNNQAERDIRMLKIKQKISGCFRSYEGSQWFCRIRGYISTTRKHGQKIFSALFHTFDSYPTLSIGV